MKLSEIRNLTLAAMFLAAGQVLPFITGQIPQIGSMLLPMHFPIFLCAFFCGPRYAALIGLICPLLRSVLFGMPAMFPTAAAMAFELCGYGLITDLVYRAGKQDSLLWIYVSLHCGMLGGRIIWGIAQTILLGASGAQAFTFQMFLARGFLNAIPGIIAQLILVPLLVKALNRHTAH